MTEQQRLERLLEDLDEATAAAFLRFVATVRSEKVFGIVADLLEAGRVEEAMAMVDSHIAAFGTVIVRNFATAATSRAIDAVREIGRINPTIGVGFNPAHPRAAAIAQQQMFDLVREVTETQREAFRGAITESLNAGTGPRVAATAVRDAVGLTEKQRQAVNNYRRLLEAGSKEALSRGLADKRVKNVENLSTEQIDRMVEAYRKRYVVYRSEVIARTESTRTLSEAGDEAFRQTLDMAGIDPATVEQTWQSASDKRTRDSHRTMKGQTVMGMDTPFISGAGNVLRYPGDPNAPASETVQCRCTKTFRIT